MTKELKRDDVLVSTGWLADNLDNPDIRILDCRFDAERDAREDYLRSHIPGAVHVDHSRQLTDPDHEVESMIPPAEQVEDIMQSLGFTNDSLIIGYDDEGGHFAARVWLILARYGADSQMRILDGGWTKWTQEDRPVSTDVPDVSIGDFSLEGRTPDPGLIATLDDVRQASETGSATLLDVRRESEFTGEEVRAKHGGRVPNSVHAFWQDSVNWDTDRTYRSPDEVSQQPGHGNVDKDEPVITYCQGGVRAANAALALRLAGYTDVRVYDGSWAEWGNRDDVPIVTGTEQD